MRQLPVSIPLVGRRVVVAGGGEAARLKTRLLAASPAEIDVYASGFEPEFRAEFETRARFHVRGVAADDFEGAALAVIALDDEKAARTAADAARAAGVPVNVVDRPALCDWHMPAIVDRDEVVIAIATGGGAPVIARDLRARIEKVVPRGIGMLAGLARDLREKVGLALPDAAARRAFWERALRGPAADRAEAGDRDGARAALEAELEAAEAAPGHAGVVHIVGAGPGDPDLLTLKAARLLADADVVFHDALVTDDVLAMARRDAERVYVGKRAKTSSTAQDDIHALMIEAARAGKRVVRLKGGDPFIFGRGGEELAALRAAGVEAHVVPGVSSALAGAAAASAPLTHRTLAQSVTFVTGHAADGEPDLDWPALARPNQTVVVFMGVGTAGAIAERLTAAGRAPSTPVAVVENATRANEIVARGKLAELAALIAARGIKGPAVLIIGEVAALASDDALTALSERAAA